MYWIGIDPGVHCGYAVCKGGALCVVDCYGFWETIDTLDICCHTDVIVVIENPALNRPIFNRGIYGSANLKIAQNVGQNKGYGKLIISYCEHVGIKYETVRPCHKKIDAATFKKLTGWQGKTNEHGRDAAMLVFGRR